MHVMRGHEYLRMRKQKNDFMYTNDRAKSIATLGTRKLDENWLASSSGTVTVMCTMLTECTSSSYVDNH